MALVGVEGPVWHDLSLCARGAVTAFRAGAGRQPGRPAGPEGDAVAFHRRGQFGQQVGHGLQVLGASGALHTARHAAQYPETVAFGLGGQTPGGIGHQMQAALFQGIAGLHQIFVDAPHEGGQRILGIVRRLGPLGHGRHGHARRGGRGPGSCPAFDPGVGRGRDLCRGLGRLLLRSFLFGDGTRGALPFLHGRGRGLRALVLLPVVPGLAAPRVETGKEAHQGIGRRPGPAGLLPAAGKEGGAVRRHVRQAGNVLAAGHGMGRLFHRSAGEGGLRAGGRAGAGALAGRRRDEGRFVRGHQTWLAQFAGDLVRADVPSQGTDRDHGLHRGGRRFLPPGDRTADRCADGHGLAHPFTGMAQAGAHIAAGKGTSRIG